MHKSDGSTIPVLCNCTLRGPEIETNCRPARQLHLSGRDSSLNIGDRAIGAQSIREIDEI